MKVTIKAIPAGLRTRGFFCELWVDASGQQWEGFAYATDRLVIVLGDHMEFKIEGKIIHPAIGEKLFVPLGTVHLVHNIGRTTTRWLYGYGRVQ